jgi:hypothetical protein
VDRADRDAGSAGDALDETGRHQTGRHESNIFSCLRSPVSCLWFVGRRSSVVGRLHRLLAEAAAHSGLERRDRGGLVGAFYVDRDALPARDAQREHRDQALGVHQLLAVPDANVGLELLCDIDKDTGWPGVQAGLVANDEIKLLHNRYAPQTGTQNPELRTTLERSSQLLIRERRRRNAKENPFRSLRVSWPRGHPGFADASQSGL